MLERNLLYGILIFLTRVAFGGFYLEKPYIIGQTKTEFENKDEYFFYFYPNRTLQINRQHYSVNYDYRTKNANWVHQIISKNNLNGNADRKNLRFKDDPVVPTIFRSSIRSPQNANFNRGCWAQLEQYVRELINNHDFVEVFTGPLYLAYMEVDGTKWVKYQLIGKNEVAVPTHFFKVIFLGSEYEPIAYIMPNEAIGSNQRLEKYITTIRKVEEVAGMLFTENSK